MLPTHGLITQLAYGIVVLAGILSIPSAQSQGISDLDRERGQTMLRVMRKDIEKYFYDSTYKGINLDTLFAGAAHKIETVRSNSELFTVIDGVASEFGESGTRYLPPDRTSSVDYGWTYQMIGDSCYVTGVKPGGDAEAKGLRTGDRILSIGRETPTRKNDDAIRFLLNVLNPQPGMRVTAVTAPELPRNVVAMAEIKTGKKVVNLSGKFSDADIWDFVREWEGYKSLDRPRHHDLHDSVHIWKMPYLGIKIVEMNNNISDVIDKKALLLDLRECSGGNQKTLDYLISRLFDHNIKAGHFESRTEKKDWLVEPSSRPPFRGLLVILVSSNTSGPAEALARLVQLEHRGIVIGDRTSGFVERAKVIGHDVGIGTSIFYDVSVTTDRVIMSDGGDLEGIGVVPDELILPRSSDLAQERDPALSYAAWLVGSELSPEAAGKLFPVEWEK